MLTRPSPPAPEEVMSSRCFPYYLAQCCRKSKATEGPHFGKDWQSHYLAGKGPTLCPWLTKVAQAPLGDSLDGGKKIKQ